MRRVRLTRSRQSQYWILRPDIQRKGRYALPTMQPTLVSVAVPEPANAVARTCLVLQSTMKKLDQVQDVKVQMTVVYAGASTVLRPAEGHHPTSSPHHLHSRCRSPPWPCTPLSSLSSVPPHELPSSNVPSLVPPSLSAVLSPSPSPVPPIPLASASPASAPSLLAHFQRNASPYSRVHFSLEFAARERGSGIGCPSDCLRIDAIFPLESCSAIRPELGRAEAGKEVGVQVVYNLWVAERDLGRY